MEYMTTYDEISKLILDALASLAIKAPDELILEHPKDLSYGDYATNIAMVVAKNEGNNPRELAEDIAQAMRDQHNPIVLEVTVAGPGFINLRLDALFFDQEIHQIMEEGDNYGKGKSFTGKKVLVEHSSPNLFKAFHIGHLMNNTIGEAIGRLYAFAGADLVTITYPSDVSLGIGKAVWQLQQYGMDHLDTLPTLSKKVAFLGNCYAEGTAAFTDHPEIEEVVRTITQDIYEHRDTEAYRAYQIGRDLNLEYFELVTKRLGSHFDGRIFESEAGIVGKELVLANVPQVYTESDGAIIYEGEQDGLHTRVFINKEGNPTYEAKDTGLLKIKFDRYQPDWSVFVTDHQQGPYFEVVVSAAGKINPLWKERTIHATHGRMQFKGQKMSSRLGNTPLVTDILETVNEEVRSRGNERNLSLEQIELISLSALKYTILRTQAGRDINFDPETSLSFEGDSGPYLGYTHARSKSLLRKGKEVGIEVSLARPTDWQTTNLERILYRFGEVTEFAVIRREPHLVVGYLTELSQEFNHWYGSTKIIDTTGNDSSYKLALVEATAQVLKNGLCLLGITAPEEM